MCKIFMVLADATYVQPTWGGRSPQEYMPQLIPLLIQSQGGLRRVCMPTLPDFMKITN